MITPLPFGGGEGGGANCLLVCEVTPTGPLTYLIEFLPSQRVFLSLTELTDLTEHFNQRFELTEGLRHTDFTERYCYYHY